MNIQMNDKGLTGPGQIRQFLQGSDGVELSVSKSQRYAWLAQTLKRTNYYRLRKKEKSVIRDYMLKATGYSRQQLTRLIAQYRETHWIGRRESSKHTFLLDDNYLCRSATTIFAGY